MDYKQSTRSSDHHLGQLYSRGDLDGSCFGRMEGGARRLDLFSLVGHLNRLVYETKVNCVSDLNGRDGHGAVAPKKKEEMNMCGTNDEPTVLT
ncbi:hypothetical protein CEXT_748151 [Caerostris extrusa]|uniref:Uncharacterized protein n=1 Tax=Caerostris extrusa TaxID=172846 RepID=A0AAV4QQP5_CAEEX|nr:hypothetical protein CEXT_748151 [Caerostris extrusa]